MNRVILKGHLGKDPELKYLDSGTAVATFSIATNETYTNRDGEKISDTTWHNIVVWAKRAETVAQYFSKGSEILIEGKIKTRSYQDQDGNNRYVTEVHMDSFEFCGASSRGSNRIDPGPGEPEYLADRKAPVNEGLPQGDEEFNDLPF